MDVPSTDSLPFTQEPNWDACLFQAILRGSRATVAALYAATDFAASQHTSEQRQVMGESMFPIPEATTTDTRNDNREIVSAAITDFASVSRPFTPEKFGGKREFRSSFQSYLGPNGKV